MVYHEETCWIKHVKEYRKKHGIKTYQEALKLAGPSYYEKYPDRKGYQRPRMDCTPRTKAQKDERSMNRLLRRGQMSDEYMDNLKARIARMEKKGEALRKASEKTQAKYENLQGRIDSVLDE